MSNEKRTLTAEDLYNLELVSSLEISPDGKYIIYAQQRVDRETEKKYSNLWRIATDDGARRQFTVGDQVDHTPHWSPDGSQIAFLSNRKDEKQFQLYLIPGDGGEARPQYFLAGLFELTCSRLLSLQLICLEVPQQCFLP